MKRGLTPYKPSDSGAVPMQENHPLKDPRLYYIFGVTLVMLMAFSSIVPCLPTLTRHFKVNVEQAAYIMTCYTIPGIILTPVSGMLSDRYGRKSVLVPALVISGCAGAACAFAPNFEIFLLFRFLQGVGTAPLAALNYTIIGDIYDDANRRTLAMSFNSGVFSLGMTVFPMIGGWLSEIEWYFPFFLTLIALPLAVLIWRFMPLNKPQSSSPTFRAYIKNTLAIITQRKTLILLCVGLVTLMLLYGVIYTHFPIFADSRFKALPSTIGTIFSLSALGIITATLIMNILLHHFTSIRLIQIGFCLFVAVMLFTPLSQSIYWTWPIFYIWGLGQGLVFPNLNGTLAGLAPAENRGGLMAINGFTYSLAQTVGPLLFGFICAFANIDSVFWSAIVLALFMIAALAFFFPKRQKQR